MSRPEYLKLWYSVKFELPMASFYNIFVLFLHEILLSVPSRLLLRSESVGKSKVATLVMRLNDLSTGDKCRITESNSEGLSWNRTSSNYFCLFENSRQFCFFSSLFRPSWSAINKVDSYPIKTVFPSFCA